MKKKLSGTQKRNKDKIAQANRRSACASYASEEARKNFMRPAYGVKMMRVKTNVSDSKEKEK